MKAHLTNIEHDRTCLYDFPQEKYAFVGSSDDGAHLIRLEIEGKVFKNPLIRFIEKEWEFDVEITITAKPKQEGLIIKL